MTATLQNSSPGAEPCSLPGYPDEATLVAAVRSGDERACECLVRQHAPRMLAVTRRFLRSEEDRADAVQDAFLSAFRSLGGFEGHSRLATWLHRIVVNACLMKLRAQSRSRSVTIEDLLPTFDETGHHACAVPLWEEAPQDQVVRNETRWQIRACIDRLPEPYRTVLLLRDIEEFDTDQAADLLGISVAAVKTRLHRARQALRKMLEPIVSWGQGGCPNRRSLGGAIRPRPRCSPAASER